jgi:hypothetical protein
VQIVDCEQGTPEWFQARLGIPSASRFADVMSLPQSKADKEAGKLSQKSHTYLCALVAERLLKATRQINARSLDWGTAMEPIARADYAFWTVEPVVEFGFCLLDNGKAGASPDSFVGDVGGHEIKSPENPGIHIKTILSGAIPREYVPQVQGGLWVCEKEWWDFQSFRNDMPAHLRSFVVRAYRDDEYIKSLSTKVLEFSDRVAETFDKLNTQGEL